MKVFFYQRSTHRKRQQETVEYCPAEIKVIKPNSITFVKDTVLSARKRNKKLNIKSKLAKFVPLNTHRMPKDETERADYIYTWGCVPIGTKKPYVLEMDNPYCICYYNMFWFNKLKFLWKKILLSKRLKYIVCISEACKKSIQVEFGGKVASKVKVIYPYIKKHKRDVFPEKNVVEFLFISTQFYLKGGRETIEAFKMIYENTKNFHLTVVTHLAEIPEEYDNLPFVKFVEADLDKSHLHSQYFSKTDVFILPSYQDSFGMVYLEALSFGLPIIATKMYAIPEIVVDGKNGILVNPPVHYYLDDYRLNPRYTDGSIIDVIKGTILYENVVKELVDAIMIMLNENQRKKMSLYSEQIFNDKFEIAIRNKKFLEVFEN